jgi:hypothetical protein
MFFVFLITDISAEPKKFLLSLYHFNIQYVAGGLKGLFPDSPDFDLSAEDVEDMIIKESFEPVLDLYLRHPDWHGDIELQGYFIEVLEKRHPGVLEKLRTLANSGQIELVSFHYSDQLFLAYPRADMEWSVKLNREIFERNGLPLSGVVFTQEGQFGEGMAQFMKDKGFKIALMPKNLMRYFHPEVDADPFPYCKLRDIDVILAGRGIFKNEFITEWSFFNDGELLATDGASPYLGRSLFKYKPSAVEEYENGLLKKVSQGYKISTISEYINELAGSGIMPLKCPPVLDGTWQPDDTRNLFRWMGDDPALNTQNTYDNLVLTGNFKSRNKLVALETLIEYADKLKIIDKEEWIEKLKDAWRYQLFAEVSDSTGWAPWEGEVRYSLDNARIAQDKADNIVEELARRIKFRFVAIDSRSGEPLKEIPEQMRLKAERMLDINISAPGRDFIEEWHRVSDNPVYELKVNFTATQGDRAVSVTFPRFTDRIIYSPALLEDEIVEYPLSDFGFEEITLPLSNGLIALDDDIFVIKDNSTVHLAGIIPAGERAVKFTDETAPPDEPFTWRFYVVFGNSADALSFAEAVNVHPVVEFNIPEEQGCGCIAGHGDNLGFSFVFLLLLVGVIVLLKVYIVNCHFHT